MADDYMFADGDGDGRVTSAELASAAERTSRDAGLPALPAGAPEFAARLYDLDGDGALTTDELLRAMALDAAVDGDLGALDAGVLHVFDRDRSGAVSRAEWRDALGPVQGGDAVADAIFARADALTASRGQLAPEALAAALTAMRAVLLGY
jgi:Ca2+-binding EF-hand superfamily protein